VKLRLNCGVVIALWLGASTAWADSVQNYNLADIVSLKLIPKGQNFLS
jgi:hypothetical protein